MSNESIRKWVMRSGCWVLRTYLRINRVGLVAAWYVSNVSIIFDCSMLYNLLFWKILGFIFHFYIIFGTNLLTGGPAQNCCFFAYFSVSKKRNIKWSPNRIILSGTWFSSRIWPRRLGPYAKEASRWAQGRGHALHRQARPPTSWLPRSFLDLGSKSPGSCSFQKSRSRRFHYVWTLFDILFLRNSEIGKKTTILGWASG